MKKTLMTMFLFLFASLAAMDSLSSAAVRTPRIHDCVEMGRGSRGFPVYSSNVAEWAATAIRGLAGYPANPGRKVTRYDIHKYFVDRDIAGAKDVLWRYEEMWVDLGGEGTFSIDGISSGNCSAVNLNAQLNNSQDPSLSIPALVWLSNFDGAYPIADGVVDFVMMQGAPLTDGNIREINRMLKSGGQARLDLVPYGDYKQRAEALQMAMRCYSGHRWEKYRSYERFICVKNSDETL